MSLPLVNALADDTVKVQPDRAQSLDNLFVLDCLVRIIRKGDGRKDERTDLGGRDTLAVESVVHFGLISVEGMRRHPARGLEVVSFLFALGKSPKGQERTLSRLSRGW